MSLDGLIEHRLALGGTAPVLALGAWFKNTLCAARNGEAVVSRTMGDLDCVDACIGHEQAARALLDWLGEPPSVVVHDLHPDFHSSRFGADLAAELGVPALAVQHHHAHIGAVCAEHDHRGPVLGLALDGVGLGSDGTAWGGELLNVDGAHFVRLGQLRPLLLPGGDRAAQEPWRMAAAVLHALGRGDEIAVRFATLQAHRGRFKFAGIQDAYFAAVALPDAGADFEIQSIGDMAPNSIDQKEELNVGVALGGAGKNSFQFFAGPKDTDLLKSIAPRLTQLVDFGWFFFISEPLFYSVHWLHDKYLHNYGWTIVVITVIINFLLLPLKFTSLKSMKKMSLLRPNSCRAAAHPRASFMK